VIENTTKTIVKVNTPELLALLNRALNTMEPKDWPAWVNDITGGHVVPVPDRSSYPTVAEGVRETDECEFVFYRDV
jgi:hypothetical protein